MRRIYPLSIQGSAAQSGSYILMLVDPDSNMQIPLLVGAQEAKSILAVQDGVSPSQPLTHHLFKKIMDEYNLGVEKVTVDRIVEGIFYATLHITDGFNTKTFTCRASDAITMAILYDIPILMAEEVIEETGVKITDSSSNAPAERGEESLESLEDRLRRCEECEDYEQAAEIQKKIEQLKVK